MQAHVIDKRLWGPKRRLWYCPWPLMLAYFCGVLVYSAVLTRVVSPLGDMVLSAIEDREASQKTMLASARAKAGEILHHAIHRP